MNYLSWNCRRLNNPRTVRELRNIIQRDKVSIIFLVETKCSNKVINKLKQDIGWFELGVDSLGNSGGLALLWRKDLVVELIRFSESFVDVKVYMGDFNEVLTQQEFQGAVLRSNWQIMNFRKALSDYNLFDLGHEGNRFTWCRNRSAPDTTRARLDRACVSHDFLDLFPDAKIYHSHALFSDHVPIVLRLSCPHGLSKTCSKSRRDKRFMFEAMCRLGLLQWNKQSFGNHTKAADELRQRISHLQQGNLTDAIKAEIGSLITQLEELLDKQDIMWKQ
ncbi:uncharacterized protein LOC113750407 [Coffea eugenioides]|uniref:uncharacterized protein LOC113750407 n=1 Tax=Coffea eugenioides TaxID=49369 RepID=UPI000F605104|nr:uncharacterized protein LOC113750407 [Coffea eugenioides]